VRHSAISQSSGNEPSSAGVMWRLAGRTRRASKRDFMAAVLLAPVLLVPCRHVAWRSSRLPAATASSAGVEGVSRYRGTAGLPRGPVRSAYSETASALGRDLRYAIDSAKLRDELGWELKFSNFDAGIEDTIA
jgi:hypothetical protein